MSVAKAFAAVPRALPRGRRARGAPDARRSAASLAKAFARVPRAAWVCALVACLNALCWSFLTPPFEVPDEPFHFAYTQQLAENHRLPTSNAYAFSPEEEVVERDIHLYEVHQSPENRTISSAAEERSLEEALAQHPSRRGNGAVGGAYYSPPLYYLLQTIPYGLASGGTLLDQLQLMRMLNALMGGLTALFVFLFLREALPRARWAWTVGGLGVALAPMLGFMSGAMSPDAMLAAVSAAIFYLLARAFRRGLTLRLAILIGVAIVVGFLTKLTFIGLAPGIVLGLVVLAVRSARTHGRSAYRNLGVALAIAVSPVCIYALVNVASGHGGLGIVSRSLKFEHAQGSIFDKASYIWQLYLPRLPTMRNYFPGLFTTRQLWFDRLVGFYGWLDTSFPRWVDKLALVPTGILVALGIRALLGDRAALRRRLAEIVVYGAMCLGLLALIGLSSYYSSPSEGLGYAEPRYFLPLLALFGLGLALAARGAGQRWGPAVGAVIVVLLLAQNIFSQLLVVGRYYG
ncbi:MAG TPA: DUF2142 domain-containing protein [Solirubrobacteraceae bacterium]|nr:DUF2142 domain-containing protein [Solirubrobacteraceae bacterium]